MARSCRRSISIRRQLPAGFTLVEVMLVLAIMAVLAGIGADAVSTYEGAARPERAARECLLAFRHARQLAMTSNMPTKVILTPASGNFAVYWGANGTAWDNTVASQPAGQGGSYSVTLAQSRELAGVALSVNPAQTTTFTYNQMGNLDTTAVITFTYGSQTRTLTLSRSGEPQLN